MKKNKRPTTKQKWNNYMKKVSAKSKARCKKHPQYKAIKRPNVNCDDCWNIYINSHPESGQWKELLTSLQKYGKNLMKESQKV